MYNGIARISEKLPVLRSHSHVYLRIKKPHLTSLLKLVFSERYVVRFSSCLSVETEDFCKICWHHLVAPTMAGIWLGCPPPGGGCYVEGRYAEITIFDQYLA